MRSEIIELVWYFDKINANGFGIAGYMVHVVQR